MQQRLPFSGSRCFFPLKCINTCILKDETLQNSFFSFLSKKYLIFCKNEIIIIQASEKQPHENNKILGNSCVPARRRIEWG